MTAVLDIQQVVTQALASLGIGQAAPAYRPPDIVDWAEECFFIPETSRPIVLQPHQREILRLMTQMKPTPWGDWRFVWTTWLWSTIKKSGKTTISALVERWAAETWGPFGEVYNMGNKLKQAKERAFRMCRQSILLSPPDRRGEWDLQETQMTHLPSGSIIQALPISDEGEAGSNPTLSVWTELWGFQYEAALRMWDEMQPVPTRPRSVRFVDTYAGYEGESTLLKGLWNLALNDDGSLADGAIRLHETLPVYGVPSAGLIAYIDQGVTARRMPWQQGEIGRRYYAMQQKAERPHNYLRLHENVWVTGQHAFVPLPLWDRLKYNRAILSDDVPIWLAADASVSGDCTALVAVTVVGEVVVQVELAVFEPPPGGKLDYDDTLIPVLESWLERFTVMGVAYDPYQLHSDMTRMAHRYPDIPFFPFDQGMERVRADTDLLYRIRNGKLRHTGDEGLRQHVRNADAKDQAGGEAIRIVKRAGNKPIDLLIALSMAGRYATVLYEHEQVVYDNSPRVEIGEY